MLCSQKNLGYRINENVPSLLLCCGNRRELFCRNNQLDYEKGLTFLEKSVNSRLSCRNISVACVVKSGFLGGFLCSNFPTNSNRELHALNQTFYISFSLWSCLVHIHKHFYIPQLIRFDSEPKVASFLRFFSCQKMCVGRLVSPLYFHRLLHYNGHRTNLLCYIYSIYIPHIANLAEVQFS